MQNVPFYSLERSIQDRFVESTRGKEVPNPLLYRKAPQNPVARAFALVALASVLGCVVFAWIGFGRLDHPWAMNPRWAIFVYSGLTVLALVALIRVVVIGDRDSSLPFVRGLFVYPVGVIDSRRENLVIHEFADLAEDSLVGNRLRLRFNSGASFTFADKDRARLEQVHQTVLETKQRVSLAPDSMSQRDRVLLNPLLDTGFRNPFGSKKPLVRETTPWHRYWWAIALGIGLPLGLVMYPLRNVLSEKQMYKLARKLETASGYRSYLARGGKRSDVAELLLPRAELRDARKSESVSAIEVFLETHQKSKILPEIEAALRVVLLTELDKARDKGTVSALREFRASSRHINVVEPELDEAERALFRAALNKYLSLVPASPEQRLFFTRLLEYSRTHGPRIEVRFRRQVPTDAVERADFQLKKSAYYVGPAALPAQYFGAQHAEPREAAWVASLNEHANKVFPKDILNIELGSAIPDDANVTPSVTIPTIQVTHRTEVSGVFLTKKPRGAFVGLSENIKVRFQIPGDASALEFQHSSWIAPSPKKLEDAGLNYKNLYDNMARDGFNRFLKKYAPTLFGPMP